MVGTDTFSVRAVYCVEGGIRTPIPRVDESKKAGLLSQTSLTRACAYEVLVGSTGTVIRLYPAVSGTYEVERLDMPLPLALDADVWAGPARSDQLIVLYAAAKGCRKEGRRGDAADLLSDYATLLEKVTASASWVDQRNPAKIRDMMAERRRDPFDYDIGGGGF